MKKLFLRSGFPRLRSLQSVVLHLPCWLLPTILVAAASAQTPASASSSEPPAPMTTIEYSAVAMGGDGAPLSGEFILTFSLYSQAEAAAASSDLNASAALWSEQRPVTLDATGRYTVLLGALKPLSPELFPAGEARWLGVQIGGDPELPRVLLASHPYALTAANAEQLGGHPAGDFVLQTQLPSGHPDWRGSSALALRTSKDRLVLNVIPKAAAGNELVNSAISESNGLVGIGTRSATEALQVNGNLLLTGQTTHEIQLTGTASSGRLGQDLNGPFLISDTPGKALRFLTSGLSERMRITDGGSVGIGTSNPTSALQVAGTVKITGATSGLTFPDGTTQTTAAFPSALNPGTSVANLEVASLGADQAATVGANPSVAGQVVIMPDNLDSVHSYIGQAGQQTHFRLSRAAPDNNGAKDFLITPYLYGMGIEYPGVVEVWSDDFSVHMNHQVQNGTSAHLWVGDEMDTGGLFATSFDHGGGSNSYTVLASDRFSHLSHGSLVFQVRNPSDAYRFQWGPYNSEVTRAALSNTSTATTFALGYGPVQGTLTAESSGLGAVNLGAVSASAVNLVSGNVPLLTVFPDGNVSIGGAGDMAPLAIGSGGGLTVTATGGVSASSVNTPILDATSLTAGSVISNNEATASLTLGGGTPILGHLSALLPSTFSAIPANACQTQGVPLPGASDGDTVALGIPNILASVDGLTWFGWASSQDTISVRVCNVTGQAIAALPTASLRIDLWKH